MRDQPLDNDREVRQLPGEREWSPSSNEETHERKRCSHATRLTLEQQARKMRETYLNAILVRDLHD
jgi:hypothetical protein